MKTDQHVPLNILSQGTVKDTCKMKVVPGINKKGIKKEAFPNVILKI